MNNRSRDETNLLVRSKSKQTPSDRFRICRDFTVRFGTISQLGKSGSVSSENIFKASQRKDSYGTILANDCRAVGVKGVQNLELFNFRTVCLCNSCARKIRNFGRYLKLLGMRQVASLLFPKPCQRSLSTCVNRCSKLHQATVLVARMFVQIPRVGKSLPQVFEFCRRIRTKIILSET